MANAALGKIKGTELTFENLACVHTVVSLRPCIIHGKLGKIKGTELTFENLACVHTVVSLILIDKQCGPRSDCFCRSSLC